MAEEKINTQNETEELTEEKVAEILQIRRDKLKALQDAGRDPFIHININDREIILLGVLHQALLLRIE